jgi:hypothetical protein
MSRPELEQYLNKTPTVELPGLGINFNLPLSVYLYYNGEVEGNLLEEAAERELRIAGIILESRNWLERVMSMPMDYIAKQVALGRMRERFPDAEAALGHCILHKFSHRGAESKLFVISKKTGLEHNISIFADGHESGEFLQKIGKKDVMNEALSQIGVNGIDATQFTGEDFADIGGFIALRRALDAGDEKVRIPNFETNREWRIEMGKKFGLKEMETETKK